MKQLCKGVEMLRAKKTDEMRPELKKGWEGVGTNR